LITQQQIHDELRTERERLTAYLNDLPEAAWDKPSLCDGWRVRDVVAHLVGNAHDIAARNLEGAGSVEYNQRQIDERADRSPAELLAEWAEQGALFEEGVIALDDDFWNAPYPPFGTVGHALQRLVEDLWVHAQDVRLALGQSPEPGPGVHATLEVTARELAERAPRLAPDVGVVTLAAGDFKETVKLADSGAAVSVEGDPATLALVATGRISLDKAAADNKVKVTPSAPAGFADALNIYGP
jgi:uncharacterized protein (TIGR03083 family)